MEVKCNKAGKYTNTCKECRHSIAHQAGKCTKWGNCGIMSVRCCNVKLNLKCWDKT